MERTATNRVLEIGVHAFGVRVAVGASSRELLERIRPVLPPGWQPCDTESVEERFAIVAEEFGTYGFAKGAEILHRGLDLELALIVLDSQLRLHLGVHAPNSVFIHAGVVAHRGMALVLPGRSFAGKTTLVAALVRCGAIYYSDEFAVLDDDGLVHPYAKPLSLRGQDDWQTDHAVETLGGVAGDDPIRIGAVVATTYRAGARWQPRRLSGGEGAMALLANAVPARHRPAQVMRTIRAAIDGAVVIEGERGEADELAPQLLAELERTTA